MPADVLVIRAFSGNAMESLSVRIPAMLNSQSWSVNARLNLAPIGCGFNLKEQQWQNWTQGS